MASRARLAFKMNRKGIVFTFIVVVLLSVILIAFLINIRTQNVQSKIQENNIKIETLNSFNKDLNDQSFSTILDVTNYRDPFMLVFDDRNLTINKTEITNWDLANFKLFYLRPEFRQHNDAPGFLDRLKGSFSYSTPNTNGIETVLDLNYYNASEEYSSIDFSHWKKNILSPLACEVDDTINYISITLPNGGIRYLYLDDAHLIHYNRKLDNLNTCFPLPP